jgi:hypothetical protein
MLSYVNHHRTAYSSVLSLDTNLRTFVATADKLSMEINEALLISVATILEAPVIRGISVSSHTFFPTTYWYHIFAACHSYTDLNELLFLRCSLRLRPCF